MMNHKNDLTRFLYHLSLAYNQNPFTIEIPKATKIKFEKEKPEYITLSKHARKAKLQSIDKQLKTRGHTSVTKIHKRLSVLDAKFEKLKKNGKLSLQEIREYEIKIKKIKKRV